MIDLPACVRYGGAHVIELEVWQLIDNLRWAAARFDQVKNVRDANAHAANARPPAALARIESDAVEQFHARKLTESGRKRKEPA